MMCPNVIPLLYPQDVSQCRPLALKASFFLPISVSSSSLAITNANVTPSPFSFVSQRLGLATEWDYNGSGTKCVESVTKEDTSKYTYSRELSRAISTIESFII